MISHFSAVMIPHSLSVFLVFPWLMAFIETAGPSLSPPCHDSIVYHHYLLPTAHDI